jgi:hypothetical protein
MTWKKLLSLLLVIIPAIIDLLDGDEKKTEVKK